MVSTNGPTSTKEADHIQPSRKVRLRSGAYVATVVAVVLAFHAVVATSNFVLNPMTYNTAELRAAAETLAQGSNYAIHDPNINWRALRREQIKVMSVTPDVVVFGGSRWQEAYAELLPGVSMFNAHVHSDYAEDFFALVHLLDEQGHLPDTLVLSLRYISFEPIAERQPAGWREWAFEYRRMARRLGVEPHPIVDTLPVSHWSALFSARDLVDRISLVAGRSEASGPTTDLTKDDLDIIGADGSMRWSRNNLERLTPQYALADAQDRAERNRDVRPGIDPAQVAAVEKLITYLQAEGVRVVFAQTPFHPAFYQAIEDRPFGEALDAVEQIGRRWEGQFGVTVVGGFDPRPLGCEADQFIDWHHATPECLGKVLRAVPWPA